MATPDDTTTQDPVKTALFKALGHMVSATPVTPTTTTGAPAAPGVVEPTVTVPPAEDQPLTQKPVFNEEEYKGSEGGLRDKLRYARAQKAAEAVAPAVETPAPAAPVVTPTVVDDKVTVKRPDIVAPAAPTAPAAEVVTPPPATPDLPADLSEEEEDEIKLAQFAEETDPAKYAGYTRRVTEFIKRHRDFVAKQQETNPDVELETSDEYQAFLQKNKAIPQPERKKLARAKLIDEAKREAKKELSAETDELRAKLREIEVRPQIKSTVEQLRSEATTLIDHAAAKAIKEKGKEAASADYALETGIIQEYVDLAANAANEFLHITQGISKPDPKNQTHVWLFDFIQEQTDLFEKHGGDSRVRDGKRFVSRVKYSQLKPTERENHFTLTDTDVLQLIALSAKYGAEGKLKTEQERLEKAGYVKKPNTPAAPAQPPRQAVADTQPPRSRVSPAPGSAELQSPKRDPFLVAMTGR